MGFKNKATKKNKANKESRKPIIRSQTGLMHKGTATHMIIENQITTRRDHERMDGEQIRLTTLMNTEHKHIEVFETKYKQ
mgnify:CR=1 FL=1